MSVSLGSLTELCLNLTCIQPRYEHSLFGERGPLGKEVNLWNFIPDKGCVPRRLTQLQRSKSPFPRYHLAPDILLL